MGVRRRIAVLPNLAAALLLSACTSQPGPVPRNDPVGLVVTPAWPSRSSVSITKAVTRSGTKTGASAGVVTGALVSLACGPWWALCYAGTAPALGGGGALAGGLIGSTRGLSDEAEELLRARLARYEQEHQPLTRLHEVTAKTFSNYWNVVESGAPTTVYLSVERVALDMMGHERVSLVLKVKLRIAHPSRKQPTPPQPLEYVTPAADVGLWLDGDSGYLEEQFDRAYEHVAQVVVAQLAG
jgi:hypothetical protein